MYEGAWEDGVRCGVGRFATACGHTHVGAWLADVPHGMGACRTEAKQPFSPAGCRIFIEACDLSISH